ncbi:helix-turn-helix domain-containing protein [Salipaludibacillus sp. HK11]|uniref:helix-turn-helix domain-containing protein n=1 Tax=Salipaludibacillus sp. HK11 TaxID=3394320 RepID=UPI0039FDAA90
MMQIGNRIKNLRKAKQLKSTELAKKAFISQPYLSDIEHGRTTPSLDRLQSICTVLEVSLSDFFGDTSALPPDIHSIIENIQKLSEEEREYLGKFIASIVNRDTSK